MSKFLTRITIIFLVISVTVLSLVFLQPVLYEAFPSDFSRHLVLQNVLKQCKATNNCEMIFFGDSRSMFGVDTRIIKKNLNISKEVYNLSSLGQDFYESSYYYSGVKEGIKMVVQCVSPSFFSKSIEHDLPLNKAISMYLSGYRIDKDTKKLIPNYNEFFNQSKLVNYYKSRSYLKTCIHSFLRPYLDDEIFDEKSRFNKYFPNYYTSDKLPGYSQHVIYDCEAYRFKETPTAQINFLIRSIKYFKTKGIRYILILMPVNPDMCAEDNGDFKKYAFELSQIEDISVINLTGLLKSKFFYDEMHPNKAGAKIISSKISEQIKAIGEY